MPSPQHQTIDPSKTRRSRTGLRSGFAGIAWVGLFGCAESDVRIDHGELVFVRDGIITPALSDKGRTIGGQRSLVEKIWEPAETITIGQWSGVAPARAECRPLFHVPLKDVSRLAVQGGIAPTSAVAFSPSGDALAIGGFQGDLVIVDAWTGVEQSRTVLAEAMTRRLAWSADGSVLYVGEQSPDGNVHALDPDTLEPIWSFRLGDHIESSALPAGEDRYAIYDLPAAYTLEVLANGDLIIAGTHGWNGTDGTRHNMSQMFRLGPTGDIRKKWPETAVSATFLHAAVTETDTGGRIAINMNRSADGEAPDTLPIGGVQILDLAEFSTISDHVVGPLEPWFDTTYIWQAVDVHPIHGVLLGFGDGRLILQDAQPPHTNRFSLSTGTPIMAGEVPIAASIGFARFIGENVMYTTSDTNIPWGAAAPELRPPTEHPGANGIFLVDKAGERLWSWQGEMQTQGFSVSPDQQLAILGGGLRQSDTRTDLFGAVVFDLTSPADGRTGKQRVLGNCATSNPVYFEHAVTNDGRVAVVEFPYPDGKGGIVGSYRATVMR